MRQVYNPQPKGFSLIEILVALAVFAIVILVAIGSMLSIIGGAKKAQAIKSVINNLNFAMDDMSRNLRTGSVYHCGEGGQVDSPRDCPQGNSSLANAIIFKDAKGNEMEYKWVSNGSTGSLYAQNISSFSNAIPLTAPEVNITNAQFIVSGSAANDNAQPSVLIIIQGDAGETKAKTYFNIQTTVTQRKLDD